MFNAAASLTAKHALLTYTSYIHTASRCQIQILMYRPDIEPNDASISTRSFELLKHLGVSMQSPTRTGGDWDSQYFYGFTIYGLTLDSYDILTLQSARLCIDRLDTFEKERTSARFQKESVSSGKDIITNNPDKMYIHYLYLLCVPYW